MLRTITDRTIQLLISNVLMGIFVSDRPDLQHNTGMKNIKNNR